MPDILERLEKFVLYSAGEQQEIRDFAQSEIRTLRNTVEIMGRELERLNPVENPPSEPEVHPSPMEAVHDSMAELAKMGITAIQLDPTEDSMKELHNTVAEAVGEPTFTDEATPDELDAIYGAGGDDNAIDMTGLLHGTGDTDDGSGANVDLTETEDNGGFSGRSIIPETTGGQGDAGPAD